MVDGNGRMLVTATRWTIIANWAGFVARGLPKSGSNLQAHDRGQSGGVAAEGVVDAGHSDDEGRGVRASLRAQQTQALGVIGEGR